MSSAAPHANFSAFSKRVVGELEVPGTVQVGESVLIFRPEPSRPEPVVTFMLGDLTEVRRDRAQSEIQCLVGPRKLRLRMLPVLADRLWDLLQQRCMHARVKEIGSSTNVHVGGHVDYELNAVLTVSGEVVVTWEGMAFKPGGDARFLGRKEFQVALAEIEAVERSDGNRRVILRTKDKAHVFRGAGAQRAWIALQVIRDVVTSGQAMGPVLVDVSLDSAGGNEGVFGIGARGFGFGGSPRLAGAAPSFWTEFSTFQAIEPSADGAEIVLTDRRVSISGEEASRVVLVLPERWLVTAPPAHRADGAWTTNAVLHRDGALIAGVLEMAPDGLLHVALSGERSVLATRGSPARAEFDEGDAHLMRISSDGVETRVHVRHAPSEVRVLQGIFASTAWGHPEDGYVPVALDERELDLLSGPTAYIRLSLADATLARQPDVLLTPEAEQVRATIGFASEPPMVPFACMLEVVNKRGRFLVPGTVTHAQPAAAKSRADRGQPRYQVVFRFGGTVRSANRRAFFRLPVNEALPTIELMSPEGQIARPGDVRLVNVSRSGCGLLLTVPWPVGTTVTFTTVFEETMEITLTARVVQVVQIDRTSWRAGMFYLPESEEDGAKLYNDRELVFLRRRRRDD